MLNKKRIVRLFGFMVFLLPGLITFAQQAAISILDAKTKEPVPFANVCFEGLKTKVLKHYVTDIDGKVPDELKEESKIAISYVGYETYTDTLTPGKHEAIYLKPSVLTMGEIVVTAQYTPERADKSIYRVNVITSRQIEQKAATNLNDLLSGQTNMRVSQGGVLGSSLSMQGLSGENVKFLVDGIPVIGRMNGNIDLNQMNLYNVDHVEVIEGPMSVVYGSNAIAGVINIITKENKTAAFTSFADSYIESIGVYNFDAGTSYRYKRHLFSADASRNFFSGYSEIASNRNLRWKPRRQYNADFYYLYSANKLRVKLTGQYFNEMLLDKGNLEIPYFETAFDNYFSTIRSTAKIETSYSPGKERQWSLVAAYSGYDRIKNRYLKNLTTLEKFLTPNLDDQDTTTMSNILLRAWYNQNEKFRKVNYQAGIDFNLEEGTGKRILDEKQQIGDYAAFLSIKYDPLKTVSMQPGIRLIYNTKYHAPLVYSLNMKWNPIEKLALRATYARGFKSPAIKELYLYFVDINHNVRGNPFLKAEYSNNYNLNISYNSETTKSFFSTDAGIFYNNIDNNIALAPEGNDLYTYINIGKYISKGFTVNTSWNLYPALTLVFGFSRTGQSFAFDAPGIKSATTYWNNDLTANFTYRFSKIKTTFSAYYKYTGRSPQVNPGDTESIAVGWVGDFNTLDASLMKAFWRNHLTVSAGAKNLFNVFTVPAVGSVSGAHSGGGGDSQSIAWGRTYFVKLAYSFNKYN